MPSGTIKTEKALKLNIGCGASPLPKEEGWINTDYKPGDGVDDVFDANGPWPYPDGMFYEVRSSHVLEHLPDHMNYFKETWRVLKPNGSMTIYVPHGWHSAAWWDLTHVRPWLQESFAALQPGFVKFTRNLQHEDIGFSFWIHSVTLVLEMPWARMWRFRILRPIVRFAMHHMLNVIQDVILRAVKVEHNDPRSVTYGGGNHPAVVPCNIGVLEHEYYGRKVPEGQDHHVVLIFEDMHRSIAGCE